MSLTVQLICSLRTTVVVKSLSLAMMTKHNMLTSQQKPQLRKTWKVDWRIKNILSLTIHLIGINKQYLWTFLGHIFTVLTQTITG